MTMKQKASSTKKEISQVPSELLELEELVGNFIEYWGFKKIHGRIWVHLYTSREPLDTLGLMNRLKVSKALMSFAMRDMLKYEVIQASHTGKHGVVYYQANPDVLKVITLVLRQREAIMMSATKTCLERLLKNKSALDHRPDIDIKKIENILTMTESAEAMLQIFLSQSYPKTNKDTTDQTDIFAHLLK